MAKYAIKIILRLSEIEKDDLNLAGEKAEKLAEMNNLGLPILPGFVVTTEAFKIFLEQNSLRVKIKHLLNSINYDDEKSVEKVSKSIKKLIVKAEVPDIISKEIFQNYKAFFAKKDLLDINFSLTPGAPQSLVFPDGKKFLKIKGESALVNKIREAWSSLYDSKSIIYRYEKDILDNFLVALVVQKIIDYDISGVMLTSDFTPDINLGNNFLKSGQEKSREQPQKIKDEKIAELARLAKKIEKYYYFPQEVEWVIDKNHLFILSTKPISSSSKGSKQENASYSVTPLLVGTPAAGGIATGKAVIVKGKSGISKIKQDDIMVALSTTPEYFQAIKKTVAVIFEKESKVSRAAIVAREFGKPCVVEIPNALSKIKNGQVITVNGKTGEVFSGSMRHKKNGSSIESLKTATKLFVNMVNLDVEESSTFASDGAAILSSNYTSEDDFLKKLEDVCQSFYPHPVVYKFCFPTTTELFIMELDVIKKVREKFGLNNLSIVIPPQSTPREFEEFKKIISQQGIRPSHTFKLYLMVQVPSDVILIDKFLEFGIDGIMVDTRELSMHMLGISKGSEEHSNGFLRANNEALLLSFKRIIKECKRQNTLTLFCMNDMSSFYELIEKTIELGADSISVPPHLLEFSRRAILNAEERVINNYE